jgi:uncharacterized membrane protein YtjA (UPF0391 family)
MMMWSLFFFIIMLTSAIFSFSGTTGISIAAASLTKIAFYIFLIAFAVSVVLYFVHKRRAKRKPQ